MFLTRLFNFTLIPFLPFVLSNVYFSTGQCLAGAGGGGFMYLITKEENSIEKIREELHKVKVNIS